MREGPDDEVLPAFLRQRAISGDVSVLRFNLHIVPPASVIRAVRIALPDRVLVCNNVTLPRNHRDRTRLVERARPTRYRGINQSLSILEGMPCGQIRIPTDPLRGRTAVPVNGAGSAVPTIRDSR